MLKCECLEYLHYRMYGHLTATYESSSTRLFLHGRTDTIRAASVESLAFCKAVLDPNTSVSYTLITES